jgi:hypothetical protein
MPHQADKKMAEIPAFDPGGNLGALLSMMRAEASRKQAEADLVAVEAAPAAGLLMAWDVSEVVEWLESVGLAALTKVQRGGRSCAQSGHYGLQKYWVAGLACCHRW